MVKLIVFTALSIATTAWGFSGGAPESVCTDMTPKHLVKPQETRFPYKIVIDKETVKAGEEVKINVTGKSFKGFLVQVRDGDSAVGAFQIPTGEKNIKTINCHGNKASGATHANSAEKTDVSLNWKAPSTPGKYTVYATVVLNGGTFWVAKPSGTITVA